jgi:hypothetical protein
MAIIPGTIFETLELPDDPPGTTDPCWCHSGIEFGKCHFERHLQAPESKWSSLKEAHQLNEAKYCDHPQASSSTCRGSIIRSHTLQLAGALSTIAVNRHVYGLDRQPQPDGKFQYKLIGIRQASTFTGFCAHHDAELFRPLETQPFIASKEQLFLLAYRALSKEVYAKRFANRMVPLLRRQDKGRDVLYQVGLQKFLYLHEQALRLSLRDLESAAADYREAFLASDYDRFSAYLIFTDKSPDFAVSGAIHPEFDFQGRTIQDLSTPNFLDLVTYTVLPSSSGGIVTFAWDAESASSCQKLVASLDRLPREEVPDALVRFTYEYFENCYANPCWWDSLSGEQKDRILCRISLSVSATDVRKSDCLKDDGLRTAAWKVIKQEWL